FFPHPRPESNWFAPPASWRHGQAGSSSASQREQPLVSAAAGSFSPLPAASPVNRRPIAAMFPTNGNGDLFLAESVARALRATGFTPLRQVAVSARHGAVTLIGRVPSFFMKQLAQATARGAAGVVGVRNNLDVAPPPTRDHVSPAAAHG